MQIDLAGPIPAFTHITEGSVDDVRFVYPIFFEAGSIYVFDPGHLDFERLFPIEKANAYFVIRSKNNTRFYVLESRPVDKFFGLRCGQVIRLKTARGNRDYPKRLPLYKFYKYKNRQAAGPPDQSLLPAHNHHRGHLQSPLENRAVLQMDQTELRIKAF